MIYAIIQKIVILYDCIRRKQRKRCFQPYLTTIQNNGGGGVLYAPRGHDGATRPASEFARPKGNCGQGENKSHIDM